MTVTLPAELTREQWAAAGDAVVALQARGVAHHDRFTEAIWGAVKSAAPAFARPPAGAKVQRMNAVTFRRHLDRLNLSHAAFAALFRLADERTVRRWAAGENPVPWSVAVVLILAERQGLSVEDLAGLQP